MELLIAFVGVGCLILAACAAVDSVDRLRDNNPWGFLSAFIGCVLAGCALTALHLFLDQLGRI